MAEPFVTPPASPGDRVAVIAPSSGAAAFARDGLVLACERLCAYYDLEPVVSLPARQRDDYLRDHPEVRAASIHTAFRDPEVSAVFATIGGDDQLRVIDPVENRSGFLPSDGSTKA